MSKKKKPGEPIETEWTYMVQVEPITKAPLNISISAGPEDRKRLAKRLGVLGINSLKAELEFERQKGSAVIQVTGHLSAVVEQACVVSGQKMTSSISEDIEAWYADHTEAVSFAKARQEREARKTSAELPILDEKDDPEPIEDGAINAGELVTQFLSLGINPYPQAEGVSSALKDEVSANNDDIFRNPFAALKDWKKGTE